MFFKETTENHLSYLKPIFSDFEKEYLLSELNTIINNGGEILIFDNLKTDRIYIYHTYRLCIGFCSGILSEVLWTLLTTKLIKEGISYGFYLDFAIKGSSKEIRSGHMTLDLDSKKIRQFFLEEDILKLITEKRSNSSEQFNQSISSTNK